MSVAAKFRAEIGSDADYRKVHERRDTSGQWRDTAVSSGKTNRCGRMDEASAGQSPDQLGCPGHRASFVLELSMASRDSPSSCGLDCLMSSLLWLVQ